MLMPDRQVKDHEYFMQAALAEAGEALAAKEFPAGCVMVYHGKIMARGRRLNSSGAAINEMDHAEITALRELITCFPAVNRAEIIVYSTMEPCLMCFSTLLLNGIRAIVYAYEDPMGGGTDLTLSGLKPLYRQMEVTVIPHVRRSEGLKLFKQFFADSNNQYWQKSLLAQYTLGQSD